MYIFEISKHTMYYFLTKSLQKEAKTHWIQRGLTKMEKQAHYAG